MLIIKNHVFPPHGIATTEWHYIYSIDPSIDVVRAEIAEVPYIWTQGTIQYIDKDQFDAMYEVPLFGSPETKGANSVRGLMPHIILVLGQQHFVLHGFPAGEEEAAEAALQYVRMKVELFLAIPEKDFEIDFSQLLVFNPDYLITLCSPKEAKEILRLTGIT